MHLMAKAHQLIHSDVSALRRRIHAVLVRPEFGGNVGSAARALSNMGILGELTIVGAPQIMDAECLKFAKHAGDRVRQARHVSTLAEALGERTPTKLALAATARVGSPGRPHPIRAREALEKAVTKLGDGDVDSLYLVFGPESDGLGNEEVALCDWVVTIPSDPGYRSLNLAQSVLIFAYEAHLNLISERRSFKSARTSQKRRLVQHLIVLAEEAGFVLPGDPFKMKPRLEDIFSHLPNHIRDVKTLHGLIDQVIRSLRKGEADFKGRFRRAVESRNEPERRN